MKIQIFSDLHLEFHLDNGKSFIDSMDPSGVDVLVLSGDISSYSKIVINLTDICNKYAGIPVLYVPGNHEYYSTSFDYFEKEMTKLSSISNFTYLKEGVIKVVNDQRFLGGTMWFSKKATEFASKKYFNIKKQMNDFNIIKNFERDVYDVHERQMSWFRNELQEGDILITHHLPSYQCVHKQFQGSLLNHFFVNPIDELIRDRKLKACFFGHTHSSYDNYLGITRLICNPFGYVRHELNNEFEMNKIVEV